MRRKTRKILKNFVEAINKFNAGEDTKDLQVYKLTKDGKRIRIINKLEGENIE